MAVRPKVAVFGGSFNPPHMGHAMVMQWLLWSGKVDKILVIPSDGHPLKKHQPAPLDVRITLLFQLMNDLRMLAAEIAILDVERHLPKPVYSYDLLTCLKEHYAYYDLHFVIGADILDESHKWHKWDELCEEFPLIITGREGYEDPRTANPTFPDYSSSRIRHLMATGHDDWKTMVTPAIRAQLELNMPDYPLGQGSVD